MNNRRRLIAANWKMYKTAQESFTYVQLLKNKILDIDEVDIILCAPYTSLFHIGPLFEEENLQLGAQNMALQREGAFTGEISSTMLKTSGSHWVIIGHSERRNLYQETDETVASKTSLAIAEGLRPIVCIGESLQQRERGATVDVLRHQFDAVFTTLATGTVEKVVIAYEPVWAIGTGLNADPQQILEAHSTIRGMLTETFEDEANSVRILYGGSVNGDNCKELIEVEEVDGFLVGGASLEVEKFEKIIRAAI
ncbi:MAG: triose-phosphate isomerase [Candidatus Marinimicrobia bacterium]|jgi:triosephosphate isomerase|nr:triose-phosphate isomerase [Candidatus Neomarinimicrobiota bacterium]MDP6456895.1 triose-phosphate isomerase [Candidatus Neomarinimicrobiota bacterium]MDP6592772.1 triose-phosphate isomerase [Candidatus Neomarinimicrobiota bacterium]MDP6836293.1 triose-phosphate isomerase [Candidatus Neomarinimicrobiota bacterium]MDP6965766.1 triose-phosphate isomerase [Candidatus Neomarinimicrobiota bacterium]|tara:strand:- start:422 stop:1180 length:759 start_codon:yes stop_codon:yes gene_type:complete